MQWWAKIRKKDRIFFIIWTVWPQRGRCSQPEHFTTFKFSYQNIYLLPKSLAFSGMRPISFEAEKLSMIYHLVKSSKKFKILRYSQKRFIFLPLTFSSIAIFQLLLVCAGAVVPALTWRSKPNLNNSFTKEWQNETTKHYLIVCFKKNFEADS